MKRMLRCAALLMCAGMAVSFAACGESKASLTIPDVTVQVDEIVTLAPVFSGCEAEEIVYSFEGDNIVIAEGRVMGVKAGTETKVSATSEHCHTDFKVKVTEKAELKISAPVIYSGYPAVPLEVTFGRAEDEGDVTYSVITPGYSDKIIFEGNTVRATGNFDVKPVYVRVRAISGKLSTEFNLRVARFEGVGYDGSSLNFESRIATFLNLWESKGAEKGGAVFIGDSFFDNNWFWTDFYSKYYADKNAFCFGVGSSTCEDWLITSARLVFPLEPEAVIIHCGTNDVFDDKCDADKGTAIIEELLDLILKNTDAHVYWFGIEPRAYAGAEVYNPVVAECNVRVKQFIEGNDRLSYLDSPALCFNTDGSIKSDFFKDGTHPKLENYAHYVRLAEEAGLEVHPSAASENREIRGYETTAEDRMWQTTRPVYYRGKTLGNNCVFRVKVGISAVLTNPHIQFDIDGNGTINRYFLWDSNQNHRFGVGWAKNGNYTNEVNGGGEDFSFTGEKLEIDVKIICNNGTVYFYAGTSGNYKLYDTWNNAPIVKISIGSEDCAVTFSDLSACTLADDAAEFAAELAATGIA